MIRVGAYQCKETFIAATCGSVAIASPGNDEGRVSPASVRSESADQSRGGSDSVNGAITLNHAKVDGMVVTTNGDIMVVRSSVIGGGIRVEKPDTNWSWGGNKPKVPRVVIGNGSVVNGPMTFEREVELFVHTSAKVGEITGATPTPFTESLPPRD